MHPIRPFLSWALALLLLISPAASFLAACAPTNNYVMAAKGPLIDVRNYGAKGDGVADDTTAIAEAASVLQAAGGGTLYFPKGTYLVFNGGTVPASGTLATFTTLSGVTIKGDGAALSAPFNFPDGSVPTLFAFAGCQGVTVDGLTVSAYERTTARDKGGVTFVSTYPDASRPTSEVAIRNCSQYGGQTFFVATTSSTYSATPWTTPAGLRTRNITIDNVYARSVGYVVTCQHSGNNITVRGLRTDKCHRSYYVFGCENHDVRIRSANNAADDVLLRSHRASTLQNLRIDYTNVDSDGTVPATGTCVTFQPDTGYAGVYRNIRVNANIYYNANSSVNGAFNFYKLTGTGTPDTADWGTVLEGITLSGVVRNDPTNTAAYRVFDVIGTWGTGETISNFHVDGLKTQLNAGDQAWNLGFLSALKDKATFIGCQTTSNINPPATCASKLVFIASEAKNFTAGTGDTIPAVYVGCRVSDGSLQSLTNKSIIDSEIPTPGTVTTRHPGPVTVNGKLSAAASAAGGAGLNIGAGVDPTSPANGDVWTASGFLKAYLGSATKVMATWQDDNSFSGLNTFNTSAVRFNGTGSLPAATSGSLWVAGAPGSPVVGKIYVGDGSGWQLDLARRTGGVDTTLFRFLDSGRFGVGIAPTAALHVQAGSAGLAPLKLSAGTSLTTPEAGAIEFDGSSLFATTAAAVRKTIAFLGDAANFAATSVTGDLTLTAAGNGIRVKEGVNATMGSATLVAGAATVSTTKVTASSRIFLTSQVDGGTPGTLRVSARTAGTSFTITSSSGTDTSTVAWIIYEPAP